MTASQRAVALAFALLLLPEPSLAQGPLSAEERSYYEGFVADAARRLAQNPEDLDAIWMRGHALATLGRRKEAGAAFQELLSRADDAGDRRFEARGHDGLGLVARLSGNPLLAIEHFERALDIARALGDTQMALDVRGNLAYAQLEAGFPEKARPVLEEILQAKRDARADHEVVIAATQLGTLHFRAGDLDAAEKLFLEALHAATRIGSPSWQSAARMSLRRVSKARERSQ